MTPDQIRLYDLPEDYENQGVIRPRRCRGPTSRDSAVPRSASPSTWI